MKKLQLSSNTLKIIALLSMTVDHVGFYLCDDNYIMRAVGRIAFPIFAYMIAEGCKYTKNRALYFLRIFFVGLIYQAFAFVFERSIFLNVFITFSLSILLIYSIDLLKEKRGFTPFLLFTLLCVLTVILCFVLPRVVRGIEYGVDFGFFGIILAPLVYYSKDRTAKLLFCALCLTGVSIEVGWWQLWSLFALIPLWFYSGKRGDARIKYLFYIYYPAHIAVIYLIYALIYKTNQP